MLARKFNIIGLATDSFKIKEFVDLTNILSNCISIEIKPYSVSEHNNSKDLNNKFIESVKYMIINSNKQIVNKDRIELSLSGIYNAYSNSHIYITPNNKISTLGFRKGKEYFVEYNNFQEYNKDWTENINDNCKKCELLGKCLTEHYKDDEIKDNCSGFYNLLMWYQDKYFPEFLHKSYIYNKKTKHNDIVNDLSYIINKNIDSVDGFRKYIETGYTHLTFPIKSIAVSVIYAVLLEEEYNIPKEEILMFDIFYGTDKFFKKYNNNKNEYDNIFKIFKNDLTNIRSSKYSSDVKSTIRYFEEEFKGK
jgi:hypothetical protein